jgi:hypothetical protein
LKISLFSPLPGGAALLSPRPGRRHALADGAGLDRARAGDPGNHCARAEPLGAGPGGGQAGRPRAQVPQGEEGHPHAGQQPGRGPARLNPASSALQFSVGARWTKCSKLAAMRAATFLSGSVD